MPHYGPSLYGASGGAAGVQDNTHLPQDTDSAAAAAVAPQEGADIFKTQEPPDLQRLIDRLNQVRDRCSILSAELYGDQSPMSKPYKGPPYMQRERIQHELNELYAEETSIQMQIRELLDAVHLDSVAKDTAEAEVAGEFKGTAGTIIGG